MYEDVKVMKSDCGICMKTQLVGHDLLLVNPVIKLQAVLELDSDVLQDLRLWVHLNEKVLKFY